VTDASRERRSAAATRGSRSAAARKQTAPSDVPALAISAFTRAWVDGSTSDAIAATPNAIDPASFRATIHHESDRLRTQHQRWHTSA
jgi:hypothetical protein